MKANVLHSLKYSVLYTAALISLASYETIERGRKIDINEFVIAGIITFALSTIVIAILISLAKVHINLKHLGWKRLLLVAFIIITPISIYIGNELENVIRITEHFMITTWAIMASYATVLLPFVTFRWVATGFKHETHNAMLQNAMNKSIPKWLFSIIAILASIIAAITFLIISSHIRDFAGEIISAVGINITKSIHDDGCVYYCKVVWDTNLKIAAYTIYALCYAISVYIIFNFYKQFVHEALVRKALLVTLVLCSPTHTLWHVKVVRPGWGDGLLVFPEYDYYHIITPVIMSNNPLSIGITAYIVVVLSKLHIKKLNA